QDLPADERRAQKARAYELMREDYARLKEAWDGATDYDRWFDQPLNNAALASVATYRRWLPTLKAKLRELAPSRLDAEMHELAKVSAISRELVLESWRAEPDSDRFAET